ncbi:MAG: hypothetical protein ACOCP8_01290 [archaeon]
MRNIKLISDKPNVIKEFNRLFNERFHDFEVECDDDSLIIFDIDEYNYDDLIDILTLVYKDQLASFIVHSRLIRNKVFLSLTPVKKNFIFLEIRNKVYNDEDLLNTIREKIDNLLSNDDDIHLTGFMNFALRNEVKKVEQLIEETIKQRKGKQN